MTASGEGEVRSWPDDAAQRIEELRHRQDELRQEVHQLRLDAHEAAEEWELRIADLADNLAAESNELRALLENLAASGLRLEAGSVTLLLFGVLFTFIGAWCATCGGL